MDTKEKKDEKEFLALPLLFLVLAQLGTSGDNSILNVATRPIMEALGANLNQMQIINMVYSLCAGCFMIVGGMMGIIIGWNKNFRIGAFMCMAGELVLTFTSSIPIFTWVGRSLVGIGGSILIPSVLALVVALFQGKNRAIAFGYIGAASGLAMALPLLAGAIIDKFGWRAAFGMMAVYFGIVFLGSFVIPKVEKTGNLKFDFIGSILAAVGLFCLLIGISKISVWGWYKPIQAPFTVFGISPSLPLALVGVITLFILIKIEKKIEEKNGSALIPQSFLVTPQVLGGLVMNAAIFFTGGGLGMITIPYLQLVEGANSTRTGLYMLPLAIGTFVCSIVVPKYFSNWSVKNSIRWSFIVSGLTCFGIALSLGEKGVNIPLYLLMNFILGLGLGVVSTHASNVTASAINPRDGQQSGGIQATSRNVGQAIGVALLGMILLVGIQTNVKSSVMNSNVISQEAKVVVQQAPISFMGDTQLEKNFKDHIPEQEDMEELKVINQSARKKSARITLYVMGIVIMLGAFTAKFIPHKLY